MSYYPMNYYQNYNYPQPQQQTQQYGYNAGASYAQPQTLPAAQATLQGKIVDSIDMVRVTDVPFGSFAVFPKADMSEIYIKNWNNNGTTSVHTFMPVVPVEEERKEEDSRKGYEEQQKIFQKIEELESKLDKILLDNQSTSNGKTQTKGKELNANAY